MSLSDEQKIGLAKLREHFKPDEISLRPQPTAPKDVMAKIPKHMCPECGMWHAKEKVMHLSYVGHAALTNRLLDSDPSWSWEPMSCNEQGLPMIDKDGGLWIKLTICGITRLGYGDAPGKAGTTATKEIIGDALRNGAMRFGAALNLWSKEELIPNVDASISTIGAKQIETLNQGMIKGDVDLSTLLEYMGADKLSDILQDDYNKAYTYLKSIVEAKSDDS